MKIFIPISLACIFFTVAGNAVTITGTHSVQLSTPVTPDVSAKTRAAAQDQFKKDLLSWLRENLNVTWDTTNGVDNLHYNAFGRACIARAKENAFFTGNKWTASYSLDAENIPDRAVEWNTLLDTLALRSYRELLKQSAAKPIVPEAIYGLGVQAIFYAKGRIGSVLKIPDRPEIDLLASARAILDSTLAKLLITSNEMVVAGKPGAMAQKGLELIVKLDTVPLSGIATRAFLPSGKCLLSGVTNEKGRFSLEGLRIPYVTNGTFLTIRPNPGVLIDSNTVFSLGDLGLVRCKSVEHALIFKMTKPLFDLNYRAAAVNNFEVPKDFSENTMLLKFLRDSLRFEQATVAARPDLLVDVQCQVSSYASDQTEETVVKTEVLITLKETSGADPHTLSKTVVFEKAYENGPPIPVGLYFWEASAMLRRSIRSVLENL